MDVFSRIDNCNILLHGLPKTSISNLQHLHHQTCTDEDQEAGHHTDFKTTPSVPCTHQIRLQGSFIRLLSY